MLKIMLLTPFLLFIPTTITMVFLVFFTSQMVMFTTQTYTTMSYTWTNTDILSTTLSLLALLIMMSVSISLSNEVLKIPALQLNMFIGLISTAVFLTHNILFLYLFLELSLIPITMVIMIWGYTPDRKSAIFNMVFYTIISSMPFLIFLISWSSLSSSLAITIIKWTTTLSLFYTPTMMMIFATMTFMVKLPMYPLHLWLPKAHLEAPTFGSMVLAATLLKLGGYGLMRLFSMKILPSLQFSSMFSSISILGGMLASLFCLRVTDIKKVIALSSVVHMATIIPLSCSLTQLSSFSAMIAMIFHGPASASLFLLTGTLYSMYNSRSTLLLRALKTYSPPLAFMFLIASIANMSAPPSTNLLIEIVIFFSLMLYSYLWVMILALTSMMVVIYSIIIYSSTSHGVVLTTPTSTISDTSLIALTWQILPTYLFTPLIGILL
uniref:NADH dehydrogenase subunit 4 n=1 Tax=Iheyomytilidicola lauensis TaxID=998671 RepID=UPI001EDF0E11|nr:NADH dehydrogenase subunit 4 [Iheyomytilidicola lauensis]UJV31459.1 NADH dehydrogenase subunit 4 [Iheyomytilidicola lauensis]